MGIFLNKIKGIKKDEIKYYENIDGLFGEIRNYFYKSCSYNEIKYELLRHSIDFKDEYCYFKIINNEIKELIKSNSIEIEVVPFKQNYFRSTINNLNKIITILLSNQKRIEEENILFDETNIYYPVKDSDKNCGFTVVPVEYINVLFAKRNSKFVLKDERFHYGFIEKNKGDGYTYYFEEIDWNIYASDTLKNFEPLEKQSLSNNVVVELVTKLITRLNLFEEKTIVKVLKNEVVIFIKDRDFSYLEELNLVYNKITYRHDNYNKFYHLFNIKCTEKEIYFTFDDNKMYKFHDKNIFPKKTPMRNNYFINSDFHDEVIKILVKDRYKINDNHKVICLQDGVLYPEGNPYNSNCEVTEISNFMENFNFYLKFYGNFTIDNDKLYFDFSKYRERGANLFRIKYNITKENIVRYPITGQEDVPFLQGFISYIVYKTTGETFRNRYIILENNNVFLYKTQYDDEV